MISKDLKTIEEMCGGYGLDEKHHSTIIKGISTDSRTINDKQLFIPLLGDNFDAHKFIRDAMDNGAVATLWQIDRPTDGINIPIIYVEDTLIALQKLAKAYRESLDMDVIGISGSDGKTSTKDILSDLLKIKYRTNMNLGNLNNHIGVPLTLLDMEENTEVAVVEMGVSDFGEMRLLSSLSLPDVAILTNIGEAHLEGFLTPENIAKGKMEILENLNPEGLYLYNGDDPILYKAAQDIKQDIEIKSFGMRDRNDYIIEALSTDENGSKFKISSLDETIYSIPMLGTHQIYNTTAAIIVARYFGISQDEIIDRLNDIELTPMRQEIIKNDHLTILNDSYKSNPSSLKAALKTFHNLSSYDQKILIIGDMLGLGEYEIEMHRDISNHINTDDLDYIFTIGDLAEELGKVLINDLGEDRVKSYKSKNTVAKDVKSILKDNPLIMIKASRAFELETLADELLKDE